MNWNALRRRFSKHNERKARNLKVYDAFKQKQEQRRHKELRLLQKEREQLANGNATKSKSKANVNVNTKNFIQENKQNIAHLTKKIKSQQRKQRKRKKMNSQSRQKSHINLDQPHTSNIYQVTMHLHQSTIM